MKDKLRALWAILNNNKGAKIAALLLAAVAWYAIQSAISFEGQLGDVRINVLTDPGWAVLEQSANVADVHFRGSREAIRYLDQEQIEVVVDIRGKPYEQSLTIPLDISQVRSPAGVTPIFLRPSELILSVDQESEKVVPVRVNIQGVPPEGYEVENFTTTPSEVTITGPRMRLGAIDSVRTTPIELEGRLQSFSLRVGLVSPSKTWMAKMDPERVEATVNLTERASTTLFEELRVKALLTPGVWREAEIEPSHVAVSLIGRSELLDQLQPRDIQVYVDAAGLDPDVPHELPVRVHLPAKIRVESVIPSRVVVKVSMGEADRIEKNNAESSPTLVDEAGAVL